MPLAFSHSGPGGKANLSMAERVALVHSEVQRIEVLAELSEQDPDLEHSPAFWLRPNDQLRAMSAEESTVVMLSGRGGGKTRTGAHWTIEKAKAHPGCKIHLVGRTVGDVRDVMVQGESGILAISSPDFMPQYVPSIRKLMWPNGTVALTFSSETPDQLRGPQSHFTWADEVAAFKFARQDVNTWEQITISTRLGQHPQIFATTTPKRIPLIRELVERAQQPDSDVLIVTGSTYDNRANLSSEYLQTLIDLYAGTALEEQELYGRLVLVVEGALWQDRDFVLAPLPEIWKSADKSAEFPDLEFVTVIGVDPSTTSTGDETGIVRIQTTRQRQEHISQRRAWVTADRSLQGPPEEWAQEVATLFHETNEDHLTVVVAEKNQGGEMVRTTIQSADPTIPVALIPSVKSKDIRARPVVLAYRRGRVFHSEDFAELTEQLTSWEPESRWSPDRLDALVHGLTALLLDDRPLRPFGRVTIGSATSTRTLDGVGSRVRHELGDIPMGSWRGGGQPTHSSAADGYGR